MKYWRYRVTLKDSCTFDVMAQAVYPDGSEIPMSVWPMDAGYNGGFLHTAYGEEHGEAISSYIPWHQVSVVHIIGKEEP